MSAVPPRRSDVSSMLEMLPPFALRVAATLRIADHLVEGPRELGDLARAAGAQPGELGRLLRYLATLGLFEEVAPGRFGVTRTGRLFSSARAGGLRDWLDLDGAGGRMDLALAGLLHAVRTGEPGYEAVFGRGFWDDLAADPAREASFDALMAGKSQAVARDLAGLDWTGVGRLVDVGGGQGVVLAAILAAAPHLKGTLVERAGVLERAGQVVSAAGVAGRCDLVAADARVEVPAGGDAYLLFDVLHDWDDDTALAILRTCVTAAGPQPSVLVVEELPEPGDRNGPAADLKMMVLFGGRQRGRAELGELAAAAGLAVAGVEPLPSGFSVVRMRGSS